MGTDLALDDVTIHVNYFSLIFSHPWSEGRTNKDQTNKTNETNKTNKTNKTNETLFKTRETPVDVGETLLDNHDGIPFFNTGKTLVDTGETPLDVGKNLVDNSQASVDVSQEFVLFVWFVLFVSYWSTSTGVFPKPTGVAFINYFFVPLKNHSPPFFTPNISYYFAPPLDRNIQLQLANAYDYSALLRPPTIQFTTLAWAYIYKERISQEFFSNLLSNRTSK